MLNMNTKREQGEHFRLLLTARNVTQSDIASELKTTIQNVHNWTKRGVPKSRIRQVARILRVPVDELLCNDAAAPEARYSSTRLVSVEDGEAVNDPGVVYVRMMDVEASAGGGVEPMYESELYPLFMRASSLRKAGVSPDNVVMLRAVGNSMEPRISDGDTVACNTADTTVRDGKFYVFHHRGYGVRIKILIRGPGGGLIIRSINRDEYPDEHLSREECENDVFIRGHAFWWAHLEI